MAPRDNKSKRVKKGKDITIGKWIVQGTLATAKIQGQGPAQECRGHCCLHGVYASLEERDRIMEYADLIKNLMDDTQTMDTGVWFEDKIEEDDDFPGGQCIGTGVHNDKCVFLDREGLCTLQTLERDLDLPAGTRLKPFYCWLFPLTTWSGRVEFDDLCDGVSPCCTLASDGKKRALDVYAFEFKEILGEQGYEELRRLAPEPPELGDGRS